MFVVVIVNADSNPDEDDEKDEDEDAPAKKRRCVETSHDINHVLESVSPRITKLRDMLGGFLDPKVEKEVLTMLREEEIQLKAHFYSTHPHIVAIHDQLGTMPRCTKHGTVSRSLLYYSQYRIYLIKTCLLYLYYISSLSVMPLSSVER